MSDLKHQHKGASRVDLMLCVSQGSCRSRRGLYWWTAPAHSDGFRSRGIWSVQRCLLSAQDMWDSVPFTLSHLLCVHLEQREDLHRHWRSQHGFHASCFSVISQRVGWDRSCDSFSSSSLSCIYIVNVSRKELFESLLIFSAFIAENWSAVVCSHSSEPVLLILKLCSAVFISLAQLTEASDTNAQRFQLHGQKREKSAPVVMYFPTFYSRPGY